MRRGWQQRRRHCSCTPARAPTSSWIEAPLVSTAAPSGGAPSAPSPLRPLQGGPCSAAATAAAAPAFSHSSSRGLRA
eukprot:13677297-Alexandrium_andersonii.AAC.1